MPDGSSPGASGRHGLTEAPPGFRRDRIVGIDVARGLAILGMIGRHILDPGPFPWIEWVPDNWDQAFGGRSAVLFAVIAGISIALMTGEARPVEGTRLLQARLKILIRAVALFAIGGLLAAPQHGIAVILEYYAVLFVLALPFITWRPRRVLLLAATLAIAMPPLYLVLMNLFARNELGAPNTMSRLLVYGPYPVLIFFVYILLGLGVGRLDLRQGVVQARLFAAGMLLTVVGYGSAQIARGMFGNSGARGEAAPGRFDLGDMTTMRPHSGTWFELVGSSGVALAIIAACLVLAPRVGVLLRPVAAAGSMALTIYVAHVMSMVWIEPTPENQYQVFLSTVAVTLIIATMWHKTIGRGPLERLLTSLSRRASNLGTEETASFGQRSPSQRRRPELP